MYAGVVRRVQIYLEEGVDDALAVEAARRGTSKAALIRECLRARIEPIATDEGPDELVGWIEQELPDAGTIDEIVYGR